MRVVAKHRGLETNSKVIKIGLLTSLRKRRLHLLMYLSIEEVLHACALYVDKKILQFGILINAKQDFNGLILLLMLTAEEEGTSVARRERTTRR